MNSGQSINAVEASHGSPSGPVPAAISRGRLALTASAFILAALLLIQLANLGARGRAPWHNPASLAHADLVTTAFGGEQTMLTFNSGGSDDVLVVLDSRAEQMLTYRVKNQSAIELIHVYSLPELFATGQRMGSGSSGESRGR